MPRGRRKSRKSIDEQIQVLKNKISELEMEKQLLDLDIQKLQLQLKHLEASAQ